jgi:non-ribosomal peptide synthetase-like protein
MVVTNRWTRTIRGSIALARTPRFDRLHEIFEAQAGGRPGATAVVFSDETVTYSELERRANRIARYLRARGVRHGARVALLVHRSPDAYAAMLGILKAGAAYVPLDPDYPADRIEYILGDSAASALVTTSDLDGLYKSFNGTAVRLDTERGAIQSESAVRVPHGETGVCGKDLCYLIYTSGSTGRPKGVMIEHQSACHLVCAEGKIFEVDSDDRVYQGFSLSFDASVEEIWLAFHAGATLVAATPEMMHAGPDLPRLLTEAGVTVLSCVPTLLAMLSGEMPTVRILILGGERCPERLVERWARPGRRLVNTYGPTETTVIATYVDLLPGRRVTIGRPVPGYHVHLLDDDLRTVRRGEVGEICIGGIGVARGYAGLPQETRDRFVPDPFAPADRTEARLYRTGDLGRLNHEGTIEFIGRADSQVKLRGFRVELSEIESVLMHGEGVLAAACAVREDTPGIEQLVGYVVPRNGNEIDKERLRLHARTQLPAFMVPALIAVLHELPRLSSGKLDRESLPPPRASTAAAKPAARPLTGTERLIAATWETLFHPQAVSVDDHFFHDLGGHSLFAARMVSELRKTPRFASASVIDVYEHPTIALLAAALDAAEAPVPSQHEAESVQAPKTQDQGVGRRHFRAGLIQSLCLYFVFGFRALHWVAPYLVFFIVLVAGHSLLQSAAWSVVAAVVVFPVLLAVAVAAKWIVLGRIKPGRHPLWGGYYLRWWFVHSLVAALHLDRLCGTPILPFVFRLFGARIGKDVHLETDGLEAFDLISIGDGTSIDDTASLLGSTVEDGMLIVGPATIGRSCFVGTRCVLREHTVLEDGARLEDLSLLPAGGRIRRDESWAGSPARRAAAPNVPMPPRPAYGLLRRTAIAALYVFLVLVIPLLPLLAFVPGVALLMQFDPLTQPLLYLGVAPLVGSSFVILLTAGLVALKWLLVGRVRPGTYPVNGSFYVRKWIVDNLLAMSLGTVGGLHATLYLAPWYRALGAKLGRFVELSTATSATPDLLEINDGGTIADEVSLGAPRIENGWMTLAPTRLGRRAFAGNGAVLPAGTVLGDGALVGVLSIPPPNAEATSKPGTAWLGSPPIHLPRRQPSAPFPDARTYCPPWKLRLARGSFEILRVTLPPFGFILVTTAVVTMALMLWNTVGLISALLLLPVVYMACCAALALGVIAAKWTIMGRFRPFERPLWCWYVWKLEFVNALYEFLLTPLVLEALQGTPMLPWYYRMLGAKIGRRTYFHTTGLIEFDLVEVGDDTAVNDDCVLQTHLFEDRVLKASWLRVGNGCVMGAGSVVLYDTVMENGSRLDALSLLMKGETLPANTSWIGVPASSHAGTRADRRRKEYADSAIAAA